MRRRKYRYTTGNDAVSFLLWLESRRQDDLHPEDADTRDLLADLIACLRETSRLINKLALASIDYEEARAIFHRLARMSAITENVAQSLGDFNIRLLVFAGGSYDIQRARQLIGELDRFLDRFLRRIHSLRGEIRPEIDKLRQPRLAARWEACTRIMQEEAAATQSLLRTRIPDPATTLATLAAFYGPSGQLEQLTSRVNRSALLVWQKLHTHLRELERRSHRLEDVRLRLAELAALPPDAVPRAWMHTVFQPAQMRGDLHEWTEHVKATPPQPVWHKHRVRGETHVWLEDQPPEDSESPTISIEERRLEQLADWMRRHGVAPEGEHSARLSAAAVGEFDDFTRIMEVMRSGLLGHGRCLAASASPPSPWPRLRLSPPNTPHSISTISRSTQPVSDEKARRTSQVTIRRAEGAGRDQRPARGALFLQERRRGSLPLPAPLQARVRGLLRKPFRLDARHRRQVRGSTSPAGITTASRPPTAIASTLPGGTTASPSCCCWSSSSPVPRPSR